MSQTNDLLASSRHTNSTEHFLYTYLCHSCSTKKTEISLDNLKTCKFKDNGLEDVTH